MLEGLRCPGLLAAATRPSRFPQCIGFLWRACMGAQGAYQLKAAMSPSCFSGNLSFLILLSAFGLSSSCVPHLAFLILLSSSCSPLGRHTFDHCLDAAREMHQPPRPMPQQPHGAGLMQVGAALVVARVRAWQFTRGDSLPKAFCRACTSRRTGTRARPSRRCVLRALTHSDHSIPARK